MEIEEIKEKILDNLEQKYIHYFEFFIGGEYGYSQFFSIKSKKKEITAKDEDEILNWLENNNYILIENLKECELTEIDKKDYEGNFMEFGEII